MKRIVTALALFVSPALIAQTYQYIVPVWANDLRGATQTWTSEIAASNASGDPITVRVAEVYPAIEEKFCHPVVYCGPLLPRQFEAGDTLPVNPNFWEKDTIYRLAAIRIESDAPIHVESWVHGISAEGLKNQEIAVARDWIAPSAKAFIPERYYNIGGGTPDRTNLFVVNPSDAPLELRYRIVYRGTQRPSDEERTMTVAPKSLAQSAPISAYRGGDDLPVFPRIVLIADRQFYAVASDVDVAGDVIFRGPAVDRKE